MNITPGETGTRNNLSAALLNNVQLLHLERKRLRLVKDIMFSSLDGFSSTFIFVTTRTKLTQLPNHSVLCMGRKKYLISLITI